jgi:hypothetical protein
MAPAKSSPPLSEMLLLPINSSNSDHYNVKELNKQFEKLLLTTSTAILALSTLNNETVEIALREAIIQTYTIQNIPKVTKKVKKIRDPNAPKKALSHYMVFCMRNRQEVVLKNPGSIPTDISRKLGALWNALSPEQKLKYIDTTCSQ